MTESMQTGDQPASATSQPASGQSAEGQQMLAISESAARRIQALRTAEGDDSLMLRITISGGGCSGFQYGFALDSKTVADDRVFEENGVRVVVDEVSLGLLGGARIEYVEDLVGSYFRLENPNAASSCGCGSSFSI